MNDQPATEHAHFWDVRTTVRKYTGDWTAEQIASGEADEPYEVREAEGNMLCTPGILLMLTALTGGAPTYFSAANARIGVGDSSAVAAATQTDLQGTNKVRVAMDAGWPKVGVAGGLLDNQVQFQATFGTSVGEWAGGWQEWGTFNAASGSTNCPNSTMCWWGRCHLWGRDRCCLLISRKPSPHGSPCGLA